MLWETDSWVPTLDALRLQELDGAPSWRELIPGVLRSPWRDHTTHYVGLQPACELLGPFICIGGHLTDPNEQKTQQSPGLGRSNALHPSHS